MKTNLDNKTIQILSKLSKGDIRVNASKERTVLQTVLVAKDDTYLGRVTIFDKAPVEEGKTTIPNSILKNIPKTGDIELNNNILRCGKRQITFNPEDLNVEVTEYSNPIKITHNEFEKAVEIMYAVATDDTRPILKTICVDKNNFVALDGFRLALRPHGEFETKFDDFQVNIPLELMDLYKKLGNKDKVVELYPGNDNIALKVDNILLEIRAIAGNFIKYEELLPKEHTKTARFNAKTILDTLKSYGSCKFVKMDFELNKLTLKVNTPECSIKDEFDIDYKGDNMEIAFNPKYLIDILKIHKDDEVVMKMNGPVNMAVIVDDFLEEKYDIVLPIKIRREGGVK